jgi:23S rRNA G2069 N7-methylase RlmK/C1962 C5-methylase RlmI
MSEKTESQALMLGNRLEKRYRHLAKWARRTGTGAFRLYDRDIPEIPLVLDLYWHGTFPRAGDRAPDPPAPQGQWAVAGSLYRRPYEKDPAEEERWLTRMEEAIGEVLGIPPSRIFMRERRRRRQGEPPGNRQVPKRALNGGLKQEGSAAFAVAEGGLQFWVDLSNHLDTGLFLDRRLLRALVRAMAAGKQVLNLFAYTCSFSVYAAAGAQSVDSVDLSNTYLNWGRRNFTLNGLQYEAAPQEAAPAGRFRGDRSRRGPEGGYSPFQFIRADARAFLDRAVLARRRWDLIVLDPPTFSNSKMMAGTLDIRRDHGPFLKQCLDLLNPGGALLFSVNMKGFKLDTEWLHGRELIDMTEKLRDEDFKDRRIPSCYLFKSGGNGT